MLSEGERGLLGVGSVPARVVATAALQPGPSPESAESSPLAERLREFLERVSDGLDLHCLVEVHEDEQTVTGSCRGGDLGPLIGRHGQTIDAVQYLANAILARHRPEGGRAIVVDAAGYRARRQATLDALAVRSAEDALATGSRVALEPMSAVERKVVHARLHDYPGVETASEGTEPSRFVVVLPAGG